VKDKYVGIDTPLVTMSLEFENRKIPLPVFTRFSNKIGSKKLFARLDRVDLQTTLIGWPDIPTYQKYVTF
jgi:hypothetical protein